MTGSGFFFILALLCMVGVVISFVRGMAAMAKTAQQDRENSNKMMRHRVLLQGGAIFFLFLAYLAK
jgi:hypothetical protein